MFSRKATFKGGTHIPAEKDITSSLPIIRMDAPEYVYLPLSMHIGAPAKPIVSVGEKVKLGQLVAAAQGFVSSNIHASVSGMVTRFEKRYLPNGSLSDCIIIKNDGLDTMAEDIKPGKYNGEIKPETIRQLLLDKGIVGMGGASFPTHVKYAPPKDAPSIDTVIINGIECEPFITADHRILLEAAEKIINGLKYFIIASSAQKGIIAIEDNKPDAIQHLTSLTRDEPNISVMVCKEKYPQGSEKQLIYAVTGRTVPDRGLPSAVGVIVDNATTAMQTALAVEKDLPCYERVLTVSGDAVQKPGNYLVRIGTLYSDVIEKAAGGIKNCEIGKILCGGPMMGFAVGSLQYSVIKGTTGLLLFSHDSPLARFLTEETCVRCGHCLDVCPMFLEPTVIVKAVKRRKWMDAAASDIASCIECGCCSYNCPSHIPLVQYIRMGKQFIMTGGSGGCNPLFKN
ncbi:MAG: electron transport complex subunit RsxC [Acidaminococcaceae bacterium]